MLDPVDLLNVAKDLAQAVNPSSARWCRSVSTAYYALFHAFLRRAADDFVGSDHQGEVSYTLLYRGFTHTRMRQVCEELDKPHLRARYRETLKRASVGL